MEEANGPANPSPNHLPLFYVPLALAIFPLPCPCHVGWYSALWQSPTGNNGCLGNREGLVHLCVCPGARPRAVFLTTGQTKGPAAPGLKDGAPISLSVLKKTFEVNLNSLTWFLAEMCPILSNPKKSKFLTPLNIKLISRLSHSHFLQRDLPEEVK